MNRILLTGVMGLALTAMALPAVASPLTPDEALERASSQNTGRRSASGLSRANLVLTTPTQSGEAALYTFVPASGEGFMILSADDMAYPVLGYSDSDRFDPNNIPPQLQAWLMHYASQIEQARIVAANRPGAFKARKNAEPTFEAIAPLVTTKWDQGAPFNDMCPSWYGQNTYTGCVATSMAQVMNYFQYPEIGTGAVSYYSTTLGKNLTMVFSEQPFDWDNMLDVYDPDGYTQEEANAVAYLMKACGYSMEMIYNLSSSAAPGYQIPNALTKYFQYDPSVRYVSREPYSDAQWSELIYNNLKEVGPIIYNGNAPNVGGHSFVCDGYDGNGLFHFNWGWGGLSDGYYSLEALSPDAVGIGGFAGGFNVRQEVVLGIRKPDGNNYQLQPNVMQTGSLTGTVEGNIITFSANDIMGTPGVVNHNSKEITIRVGAIFTSLSDAAVPPIVVPGTFGPSQSVTVTAQQSYGYNDITRPIVAIPDTLPDGEYKVTLATLAVGFENAVYQPIEVKYGDNNYVILTADSGSYSITDVPGTKITVESAEFIDDVVIKSTATLRLTLNNNSDKEVTRPFCALLELGEYVVIYSSTQLVTIPADTTIVADLTLSINPAEGYTLDKPTLLAIYIVDPETGYIYGDFGGVTVRPVPANVFVTLETFALENIAGSAQMNIDGVGQVIVYQVADPADMTVHITLTPSGGYFDGDLVITAAGVGDSDLSTGIDEIFRQKYGIVSGSKFNTRVNVSYPDADYKTVYELVLYGDINGQTTQYGKTYMMSLLDNGVEGIYDDGSNAPAEYLDLQGRRLSNPQPGQLVIKRQGSKVSKIVI